eukprot:147987-Prorocentrum_minimum.AAC.1
MRCKITDVRCRITDVGYGATGVVVASLVLLLIPFTSSYVVRTPNSFIWCPVVTCGEIWFWGSMGPWRGRCAAALPRLRRPNRHLGATWVPGRPTARGFGPAGAHKGQRERSGQQGPNLHLGDGVEQVAEDGSTAVQYEEYSAVQRSTVQYSTVRLQVEQIAEDGSTAAQYEEYSTVQRSTEEYSTSFEQRRRPRAPTLNY